MEFVTRLEKKWHSRKDLDIQILRTELATSGASGNKHYKLADNLKLLKSQGCKSILSFGGAWSNHLYALSFEARRHGLGLVAIVRGDSGISNRMLQSAQQNGMRVVMVSRSLYRQRNDPIYCQRLCQEYGCETWLPEGGSTTLAVKGCENILRLFDRTPKDDSASPNVIALAVGTGATMAGVVNSARTEQSVVGLPVVADSSVPGKLKNWLDTSNDHMCNWRLTDPLKPRYAKVNLTLISFILRFYDETGIALDPVYTGKALQYLLSADFTSQLAKDTQLLFIHTGGLMGSFGYAKEFAQCKDPELVDRYFQRLEALLVR